ncbi:MAG: hypothetical protein L0177_06710 [Chloroflexi bacterium]|nr:hypothetical protein [Chloroflexota bacterium]
MRFLAQKMTALRWLVAVVALVGTLAAVTGLAQAGGRWSGIDPELRVNGDRINIWVEWPTEYTCDIEDMDVLAVVPLLADAELVAESAEKFRCDNGRRVTLQTNTSLVQASVLVSSVSAVVKSDKVFPVRLKVSMNGGEIRTCTGLSNVLVTCVPYDPITTNIPLLNNLLSF